MIPIGILNQSILIPPSGGLPPNAGLPSEWIKADDNSTLFSDLSGSIPATSQVLSIRSKGQDNSLLTATGGIDGGTISLNQQNGKQLIVFDGIDDHLSVNSLVRSYSSVTVICCLRVDIDLTFRPFVSFSANAQEWADPNGFNFVHLNSIGGLGSYHDSSVILSDSSINQIGNFIFVAIEIDFSNNTQTMWFDGTQVDSTNVVTASVINPLNFAIGGGLQGAGIRNYTFYSLGELVIYPSLVYALNKNDFDSYILNEWGV